MDYNTLDKFTLVKKLGQGYSCKVWLGFSEEEN